jgi:hypothetical protein
MKFPNYDEQSASPPIDDPGVAIRIVAESFGPSVPAILHGRYLMDAPLIRLTRDEGLSWIIILAVRRDSPGIFTRAARPAGPMTMRPLVNPGPSTLTGGWFNLDLRAHLGLDPGSYWVAAFLGDHRSGWLPLELRSK